MSKAELIVEKLIDRKFGGYPVYVRINKTGKVYRVKNYEEFRKAVGTEPFQIRKELP